MTKPVEPHMNREQHDDELRNLRDEVIQEVIFFRQKLDGEHEKKNWMSEHGRNQVQSKWLDELSLTALHVLDAIGVHGPVNGITVSRQINVPKGSVSKITRKLLANGLIEKSMLPVNKKEIYFRLTDLGREIFELHKHLHQEQEQLAHAFFKSYSEEELKTILRFLRNASKEVWMI